MDEKEIQELKKFIMPTFATLLFGLIFIVLGFFPLMSLSTGGEVSSMGFVSLLLFAVGGFFIYLGIRDRKKPDKIIAEFQANGGISALMNDFKTGGKAFKNNLIVGQYFLIGKHNAIVIQYNEIKQIYQYVHSTNFVEDSRTLRIVSAKDNKVYDLCKLELRGKSDDEVSQVISFILSKNPNVRVGYK